MVSEFIILRMNAQLIHFDQHCILEGVAEILTLRHALGGPDRLPLAGGFGSRGQRQRGGHLRKTRRVQGWSFIVKFIVQITEHRAEMSRMDH